VITNDNPDGGGGGVGYWTIDNVYRDPCGTSLPVEFVDVGTTVEELVAAFPQQELSRVTQPVPVTIDGYQGLSLEVHAPKDLDIATCPKYRIWEYGEAGGRYMQEPGDWDRLYILDVEGEIVVLTVTFALDASQAGLDLATSIVESVDFVPRSWPSGATSPSAAPISPPSERGVPASELVARIPIAGFGIAVDSGTGLVFVAANTSPSDGSVSVVDTVTGKVIDTVTPLSGGVPWAVAVDATAGEAYVTYPQGGTVAVVDTATREAVAEISVGDRPLSVAVDPEARALYVGMVDGNVSVIDTTTRRVVDTVTVGDNVTRNETPDLAVDPRSGDVYVANSQTDTLSVIDRDSRQVVETIRGLGHPQGVAVDPSTGQAYVSGTERVSVIDTRTRKVIDTITTPGSGIGGVAVDPTAGVVYVSGMTVIDTRTHNVVDTISGRRFHGIAVDPTTGNVYLTQGFARVISVLGAP